MPFCEKHPSWMPTLQCVKCTEELRAELAKKIDGCCCCDDKKCKDAEIHRLLTELKQLKHDNELYKTLSEIRLKSVNVLQQELANDRMAWDIYDALYPGCYHNSNYFRNKAREK